MISTNDKQENDMKTEIEITAQLVQIEECNKIIHHHQTEEDHYIDLRNKMLRNLKLLETKQKNEI